MTCRCSEERLTRAEKWHQSAPGVIGQASLCGQGAATLSPAAISRSRASMIRAYPSGVPGSTITTACPAAAAASTSSVLAPAVSSLST